MAQNDYTFLAVVALATITMGVVTTLEPFEIFFIESTVSTTQTTVTMAWITWLALVGFAAVGSVEAELPCSFAPYVGDVQRALPIPSVLSAIS